MKINQTIDITLTSSPSLNLPDSPFTDTTLTSSPSLFNTSSSPSSAVITHQNPLDLDAATPNQLVLLLHDVNLREEVVDQLVKKRDTCENLALLLWNTFNVAYILLQEVTVVYRKLSPSKLSPRESTRACKALALFQVMANNPETRKLLFTARIPYYLYPFLKTNGNDDQPLEYLRLTSLGVLGSLTTFDDPYGSDVLTFFMESQVVPLCLGCMDLGDELSSMVATLIVMKMLMQEAGMTYCCASAHRFYSIVQVLYRVIEKLFEKPCLLHLKYVVRCYLSLSVVLKFVCSCATSRRQVPPQLFDNTSKGILRDDPETSWMLHLLHFSIYGCFPAYQISNNIAKPDTTTQKAKGKGKKKK
ncbi:cell differentiation protein rcd1-like [Lycium ferocissimum]|uniref:cell differentiation protein rcd1-like n=1 Tax=Lycium ferocissimum TaxID=112874 RepID=UPI002815D224|nr:cell differentiation protein rcd1-like [Lycium ferocissimum]